MPIQSEYTNYIKAPSPGTLTGSGETIDSITGNAETDGIPFGRAVSEGNVAVYGDNAVILGGSLAGFVGVSVKDITLGTRAVGEVDQYHRYDNVGVLQRGMIWVEPAVAVVANDPVHFDAATGIFTNTGGLGPIKGAKWVTSCPAAGRAILFVPGLANMDAV